MSGVRLGAYVIVCSLFGCTPGDPGRDPDSGPDADVMMPEEVLRPWPEGSSPAALPNFLPCPTAWAPVDDGEVVTCAPFPAGTPDVCRVAEAHFPGQGGCQRLGALCPTGRFAEDLPADENVIFVDGAAAPGGDGRRGTPFRSLTDVTWFSLHEGTTVALSKGEFVGAAVLQPGVQLIGACVEETVMVGGTSAALGAVMVDQAGPIATVRNLTIRGAQNSGLRVDFGARLEAFAVLIEGARFAGAYAGETDSELSLTDVVIRNTEGAPDGHYGFGLVSQFGARVTGTRVVVDRSRDTGVLVGADGAVLTLENAVVSNTRPRVADDTGGRGVSVQDGGHFTATRTLIRGNRELGVFAGRAGSKVVLTDVVIADTLPQGGGANNFGRGITIQHGAHLEMTRAVIEESHDAGLSLASLESVAIVIDTVIRNTKPELRTGGFGRGISMQDGAELTATRMLVANSHDVGVVINSPSTMAYLEDITIIDTQLDERDGAHGHGMQVQVGAHAEVHGLFVRSSHTLGVAAIHAALVLENAKIQTTEAAPCIDRICNDTPFGYGVAVISSSVRMSRFVVAAADTCGVFLAGEAGELDLREGLVSGSAFGACVQVADYDFGRLTEDVRYTNNTQNLEATSLPVPESVAGIRQR